MIHAGEATASGSQPAFAGAGSAAASASGAGGCGVVRPGVVCGLRRVHGGEGGIRASGFWRRRRERESVEGAWKREEEKRMANGERKACFACSGMRAAGYKWRWASEKDEAHMATAEEMGPFHKAKMTNLCADGEMMAVLGKNEFF